MVIIQTCHFKARQTQQWSLYKRATALEGRQTQQCSFYKRATSKHVKTAMVIIQTRHFKARQTQQCSLYKRATSKHVKHSNGHYTNVPLQSTSNTAVFIIQTRHFKARRSTHKADDGLEKQTKMLSLTLSVVDPSLIQHTLDPLGQPSP